MSRLFSTPAAIWRRLTGRSPTESQQILEAEYQGAPDHPPTSAESVTGGPESMSVEDLGALSQRVEDPNGLLRGGATRRAPQGFVSSTPAAPGVVDHTSMIPEQLTPVLDAETGLKRGYQPPPYQDVRRPTRVPDLAVDDRRHDLLRPDSREFQARREPPRRSLEDSAVKERWISPDGEGARRSRELYGEEDLVTPAPNAARQRSRRESVSPDYIDNSNRRANRYSGEAVGSSRTAPYRIPKYEEYEENGAPRRREDEVNPPGD